jgi:hypothetical protein
MAATVDVVTNGSFETGMTGWTFAAPTGTSTGTVCVMNSVAAPGTEVASGAAGFAATDGTNIALGSDQQTTTSATYGDCTLYQDVAIPVGATTANFSATIGQKQAGGKANVEMATKQGLYSTATVPTLVSSVPLLTLGVLRSGVTDAALNTVTAAGVNVAPYAGTTVRLAMMLSSDTTTGYAVMGVDNVSMVVTYTPPVTAPTLSEWAMIAFAMLIVGFGVHQQRRRQS